MKEKNLNKKIKETRIEASKSLRKWQKLLSKERKLLEIKFKKILKSDLKKEEKDILNLIKKLEDKYGYLVPVKEIYKTSKLSKKEVDDMIDKLKYMRIIYFPIKEFVARN
ncbi:MAG: hypothetical protein QW117_02265 [Candidatus Pacearchaeota archaeon]